jgi:phospholipid/cholesterol/gamma-HCH transport system substrate-binding protein
MENRPYALSAGLFLLLLCVGLVLVAIRLSGNTGDQIDYVVESRLPVSGLNPNAPVRLRGVNVGKVRDVRFSANDPDLILIGIAVDKHAPLTKGTFAKLGYLGITGLSYLQLDSDPAQKERLATGGSAPPHIELQPSFIDQISGSGEEFLRDANQTVKRLNTLLSDRNLAELSTTLSNLKTASGKIIDLENEVQPAVKRTAGLALRANKTLEKVEPLIGNLDKLTQDIRTRVVALDRIGKSAEDFGQTSRALEDAVPRLHTALDDFSRSLRAVDRVLSGIEQQPQSILFGPSPTSPGPGEAGFDGRARPR